MIIIMNNTNSKIINKQKRKNKSNAQSLSNWYMLEGRQLWFAFAGQ